MTNSPITVHVNVRLDLGDLSRLKPDQIFAVIDGIADLVTAGQPEPKDPVVQEIARGRRIVAEHQQRSRRVREGTTPVA